MAKKSALDKLNQKLSVAESNQFTQPHSENGVEQNNVPIATEQNFQPQDTAERVGDTKVNRKKTSTPPKQPKAPRTPKPPKEQKPPKEPKPKKKKKKSALDKVQNLMAEQPLGSDTNVSNEPEVTETITQESIAVEAVSPASPAASVTQPANETPVDGRTLDMNAMPAPNSYNFDDDETNDILYARKKMRKEKLKRGLSRTASVILVLACIYIIFLIYGTFVTEYTYDEHGNIVPQFMSVDEIRELEEFNNFAIQYRQARAIYEEALRLDYRIGAGVEDPLVVAPDYEKLLESIEQLAIDVQATTVSSKYTQTHSMLLQWVQTDIAVYCQRMSQAISQNNAEYAAQALEYKNIVYNDFSLITGNIKTLGETVNGADISDIASWSPEKYVRENIG